MRDFSVYIYIYIYIHMSSQCACVDITCFFLCKIMLKYFYSQATSHLERIHFVVEEQKKREEVVPMKLLIID